MNRLVNPQYWPLKIVAFVAIISCQRTENNYGIQQQDSTTTLDQEALKIDLSKVPTLGVNDEAIIKKYQGYCGQRGKINH